MNKCAVPVAFMTLFATSTQAQTAPETLAYLFFSVSVPPKIMPSTRTDIVESTPKLIHFKKLYTGYKREFEQEDSNIKIEQKAPCQYTVTGNYRWGDAFAELETTLDFSNLNGSGPEVAIDRRNPQSPTAYLKISGVKACSLKGSHKKANFYYQFPESGQCFDTVYSSLSLTDADISRMQNAYKHFNQTFCKGRAF